MASDDDTTEPEAAPVPKRRHTTVTVSPDTHERLKAFRKRLRALGDRLPESVRVRLEAAERDSRNRERGTMGLDVAINVVLDAAERVLDTIEPAPPVGPPPRRKPTVDATAPATPKDFDRYPITGEGNSLRSIASLDAEAAGEPVPSPEFDHRDKPEDSLFTHREPSSPAKPAARPKKGKR